MFVSFRVAGIPGISHLRPGSALTVYASPPINALTDRDPQDDPGRRVGLQDDILRRIRQGLQG
jgi:hypothetical protein